MFPIRYLIVIFFILSLTVSFALCQTVKPVNDISTESSTTVISDNNAIPVIIPSVSSIPAETSSITSASPLQTDTTTVSPIGNMTVIPSVTPDLSTEPSSVPDATPGIKKSEKKEVPVTFNGEELFSINTALGPYSPEERAGIILDRLEKVSEDRIFKPEDIKVEQKNTNPCVIYKDIIIITVCDEDGIDSGLTSLETAEKYAEKIRFKVI